MFDLTPTDVSMRSLLPAQVAVRECRIADVRGRLLPVEEPHVAAAVEARKRAFLAGRVCARGALEELRVCVDGVAARPDRQPAWPPGVVGSITHSEQYCAAAVAPATAFRGIGIDIEDIERCDVEMLPVICTARELAAVSRLPPPLRVRAGALLFSAKEAFFKCQYPVTGAWLYFHHVDVHARSSSALAFTCRSDVADRVDGALFHGRYAMNATTVATAVVLGHRDQSS
jgi:4'-phosphopantetheinyl transferase EntD